MPPTINKKGFPTPTLTRSDAFFSTFWLSLISLISIENKCLYDAIQDLKMEKYNFGKRWDWTRVDRIKSYTGTWVTIWAITAEVLHELYSIWRAFYTSCLTDISSSQRWVIYSQNIDAVSNYTYLFRFVFHFSATVFKSVIKLLVFLKILCQHYMMINAI